MVLLPRCLIRMIVSCLHFCSLLSLTSATLASPQASVHQLMPPTPSPRLRARSSPPLPRLTMPFPSPGPSGSGASTPRPPHSPASTLTPIPSPQPHHAPQMPSFSIVGALEFRQVVTSLQTQSAISSLSMFDSPITPYAGGHYHQHVLSAGAASAPAHAQNGHRPRSLRGVSSTESYRREVDPWDQTLGGSLQLDDRLKTKHARKPSDPTLSPYNDDEPTSADAPLLTNEDVISSLNSPRPGSVSPTRSVSPTVFFSPDREAQAPSQAPGRVHGRRRAMVVHVLKEVYHTLVPSLHGFRSKTLMGKLVGVFAAPAILALTLTLPVVVTPHHGNEDGAGPEKPVHGPDLRLNEDGAPLIDFEDPEEASEERERERMVEQAEEMVEHELHVGEGLGATELGFNKWLTAAQCVCAPLWCVGVLFSKSKSSFLF